MPIFTPYSLCRLTSSMVAQFFPRAWMRLETLQIFMGPVQATPIHSSVSQIPMGDQPSICLALSMARLSCMKAAPFTQVRAACNKKDERNSCGTKKRVHLTRVALFRSQMKGRFILGINLTAQTPLANDFFSLKSALGQTGTATQSGCREQSA